MKRALTNVVVSRWERELDPAKLHDAVAHLRINGGAKLIGNAEGGSL
jgi:hypothetical protein